jgi:hypothetical protein
MERSPASGGRKIGHRNVKCELYHKCGGEMLEESGDGEKKET